MNNEAIMAEQSLTDQGERQTEFLEQLLREIQKTPQEYWPSLLQMVRLFRESVTLKPAEASFRQGWQEAIAQQTLPLSQLWEGIDDD